MVATDVSSAGFTPEMLALFGRVSQARLLALRTEKLSHFSQKQFEDYVEIRLASVSAVGRLLNGEPVKLELDEISEMDTISILFHLTRGIGYGSALGKNKPLDVDRKRVLAEIAKELSLQKRWMKDAASFFMHFGEYDYFRDTLPYSPAEDVFKTKLSRQLIRLVGDDRALEIYKEIGGKISHDWYYRTRAHNKLSQAEAKSFLIAALDDIRKLDDDKRLRKYSAFVFAASKWGEAELAEEALSEFEALLGSKTDASILDLIFLARRKIAHNVQVSEVISLLQLIEKRLKVIDGDLRVNNDLEAVAKLYLNLGEIDEARRVFFKTEYDLDSWESFLKEPMSIQDRNSLFDEASLRFSRDDYLLLRSGVLALLAGNGHSTPEWVLNSSFEMVRGVPPEDSNKGDLMYDRLGLVSKILDAPELASEVLEKSIDVALDSMNFAAIIGAAYRLDRM